MCSFKELSLCNLVKQQEKTLQEHTSRQEEQQQGEGTQPGDRQLIMIYMESQSDSQVGERKQANM